MMCGFFFKFLSFKNQKSIMFEWMNELMLDMINMVNTILSLFILNLIIENISKKWMLIINVVQTKTEQKKKEKEIVVVKM